MTKKVWFDIPVEKFVSFRGHVKFGKGKVYNDKNYQDFHSEIKSFLQSKVRTLNRIASANAAFNVEVGFHYPYPKSKPRKNGEHTRHKSTAPDVDNIGKSVLDAMEGIVYKNDSQISKLGYYKQYADVNQHWITLKVERLDD